MHLKINPVIHNHSTPRKYCDGTFIPFVSPSIQVGHSRASPRKPISYGHSDTLLHILLPLSPSKRELPPVPISSGAREPHPSPTYLRRSHFSIYGPAFQMKTLDIPEGLKVETFERASPILISFSKCVNVQPWLSCFSSAAKRRKTKLPTQTPSSLIPGQIIRILKNSFPDGLEF
ncbi:hypothetical protein AVEN_52039-1 [Araneus ventricosus]|uniref:Uncharacterized protein n=1 Tax=Araneus ventricosus TaxID=182803 RepID=A0A4Y2CEM5_ARAVE|nr:hypothetical protein AVEN_52039-1 [Araneus ventricosus]